MIDPVLEVLLPHVSLDLAVHPLAECHNTLSPRIRQILTQILLKGKSDLVKIDTEEARVHRDELQYHKLDSQEVVKLNLHRQPNLYEEDYLRSCNSLSLEEV